MKTTDQVISELNENGAKNILSNVMFSDVYESEQDKINHCANVIKSAVNDVLRGIDNPELEKHGYTFLLSFVPTSIHDLVIFRL